MPKEKGHMSGKARVKPYDKSDQKDSAPVRKSTEDKQGEIENAEIYPTYEETNMDTTANLPDSSLISSQWKFNKLLDDISESLTDKELPRMKFYCTAGCLGRKGLTSAQSPLQFFQLLMDMEFLSCYNLLHLQAMLWHIGRKDLHKRIVAFARECRRQPLYFFSPKSTPVNGFKHVKFHIGGSETNRREVENLRSVVAELLCVRHEDVALVGFEPSNSIVITFMMPKEAIDTLHDLVPEDRSVLKYMKVDYIFEDEQEIPLIGERMEKPTTISQMKAVSKLLADEKQLRTKVEKLQCLLLERNEEVRQARYNAKNLQLGRDQAFLAFLTLMNRQRQSTSPIDSLLNKSCSVYFQHSLQMFKAKFPNEIDTIETLLEAKELLACKAERDAWKQHIESIRLLNQLEANELRIQHTIDISNLQGIRYNQKPPRLYLNGQGTQQNETIQVGVAMVTQQVQTGEMFDDTPIVEAEKAYRMKVRNALEEISRMLNPAQRKCLLRQSGIDEDDKRMNENNDQFMFNLYLLQSPNQEQNELEFTLRLVRQLDDKTLNEKIYDIAVDLAKYHDQLRVMIQ